MIITTQELLSSGMPVSDEIDERKIEQAIFTSEQFILKPRIGDSLYIDILNDPEEYSAILSGGPVEYEKDGQTYHKYLAGLKSALYNLSFALLLRDNVASTTFGSVLKKDDYSDQAGEERIIQVAKYHTEVGMQFIKEVTDYLGIDNTGKNLPNWFEEFI